MITGFERILYNEKDNDKFPLTFNNSEEREYFGETLDILNNLLIEKYDLRPSVSTEIVFKNFLNMVLESHNANNTCEEKDDEVK